MVNGGDGFGGVGVLGDDVDFGEGVEKGFQAEQADALIVDEDGAEGFHYSGIGRKVGGVNEGSRKKCKGQVGVRRQ